MRSTINVPVRNVGFFIFALPPIARSSQVFSRVNNINEALSPTSNFHQAFTFFEPQRVIKPYEINLSPTSYQGLLESINYKGEIPDELCCPISCFIMNDPIKVSSNQIFDRQSLKEYFAREEKDVVHCPLTRKKIKKIELNNATDTITNEKIATFVNSILDKHEVNKKHEQNNLVAASHIDKNEQEPELISKAKKTPPII